MLVLGLDTTTRAGSIAVLRDDDVLADVVGDAAVTHGQRLPADLVRALAVAGVHLSQLDLLAVAAGPGSFTGLRVGIATVQGLAFARDLKIVPVSTLDALAFQAASLARTGRPSDRPGDETIAVWVDAQRGEVFSSLFEPNGAQAIEPARAAAPDATLSAWRPSTGSRPLVFVGDGAIRYRGVIESTLGEQARIVFAVPHLAPLVARIAARDPSRAVQPHAVVPVYVRRSDAELARDRRNVGDSQNASA